MAQPQYKHTHGTVKRPPQLMMKGLGAGAEAGPRQELRLGLYLQVLSTRERPLLSSEFNFSPLAGGVGMALIKEMGQMSEGSSWQRWRNRSY